MDEAGSGRLRLHGYSSCEPNEIKAGVEKGKEIDSFPGDFVVYDPSPDSGFAISSLVSALPFYWAISADRRLVLGDNVFDVAKRAAIPWRWNLRSIRALALCGHTLNEDTLCVGVQRLTPGTYLKAEAGGIRSTRLPIQPFVWDMDDGMNEALSALKVGFREAVGSAEEVHLSLSAGYDSRLLLALCLDSGITPKVSVMGYEESTDVVVARKLCERAGLDLTVVEIDGQDYLKMGATIADATSGVKTAANWHTFLYHKGKDFSHGVHLVGSNGEFARSFFFDVARLNRFVDAAPPQMLRAYWAVRYARRFLKFSRYNPFLRWANVGSPLALAGKAVVQPGYAPHNLSSALDAYYTGQRVRHFIGAGLACYAYHGSPRLPFLHPRWIRAVARLRREHKRNDNYHQYCTARLAPALVELPYNQLEDGSKGPSYSPFNQFSRSRQVSELLLSSTHLRQWITPDQLSKVLNDSGCDQAEERSFWMTLHFAAEALAQRMMRR